MQLHAGGDLVLGAGATVDARATRGGANGGDVLLNSRSGRLRLDPGAAIDARGDDDQDGRIVLRALRSGSNGVAIDALNTGALQAAEVDIEAVRVYSTVTSGSTTASITSIGSAASSVSGTGAGATGTLGQTAIQGDNNAYMANAATVLSALGTGTAGDSRVHLRPGVEVRAAGDLAVASDWALNAQRPGGEAGFLTLRAAGNLTLNGSVSDGFTGAANTAAVMASPAPAWSLRLVGGADLTAADPLATRDLSAAIGETGNLTVAAGKLVRTGAGSIDLAAGRDLRFAGSGNTAATAYVAGRRDDDEATALATLFAAQTAKPTFTEHGGRLTATAGRDIMASEATQLINNWFWRSGLQSSAAGDSDLYAANSQLAWWSEFSRWRQTLGSMGGGDLVVRAGRDIENLQAMVPTSGWASSNRAAARCWCAMAATWRCAPAATSAAASSSSAVARAGWRRAAAWRPAPPTARLDAPALALMDGDWRVAARDAVALAMAFNPTAMSAPAADNRAGVSGFYYTWNGDEGLDVRSGAGPVSLQATGSATEILGYGLGGDPRVLARVMPGVAACHRRRRRGPAVQPVQPALSIGHRRLVAVCRRRPGDGAGQCHRPDPGHGRQRPPRLGHRWPSHWPTVSSPPSPATPG